jgi:hypothetical protein
VKSVSQRHRVGEVFASASLRLVGDMPGPHPLVWNSAPTTFEIEVVGAGDVTFSDASAISPPGRRFGPAELPMAFVECLHKGPVGKHVLAPRAAGVPLSGSDVLADYVDVVVVDGRRERRRWGGWFKR